MNRLSILRPALEALREDVQDDETALAERRDEMKSFQTKQERKREQLGTLEVERRVEDKQTAIAQLTGLAGRLRKNVAEARRRRQRIETIRQYERDVAEYTRDAQRSTAEAERCQKEVERLRREQREEEGIGGVDEGDGFALVNPRSIELVVAS